MVAGVAEASLPFLRFGWEAVDADGPAPEWSRLN
jgi:hypothetical protein